jgi:hypothetical protein
VYLISYKGCQSTSFTTPSSSHCCPQSGEGRGQLPALKPTLTLPTMSEPVVGNWKPLRGTDPLIFHTSYSLLTIDLDDRLGYLSLCVEDHIVLVFLAPENECDCHPQFLPLPFSRPLAHLQLHRRCFDLWYPEFGGAGPYHSCRVQPRRRCCGACLRAEWALGWMWKPSPLHPVAIQRLSSNFP